MSKQIAHNWDDQSRTKDVEVEENFPFSQMLLSDDVLTGLTRSGFLMPSPIQFRAIPLGKSGLDLIVQAKSGTGKTLVFSVIALESYQSQINAPQSLILAPTREIAVQIVDVISSISRTIPNFKTSSFIGGLNVADDRKKMANCKCVVGTPGRILQLIQNKVFNVDEIKLLVFDEADKLLESSYLADINKITRSLKGRKQMIACSATLDENLRSIISSYMKNPTDVTPRREMPVLLGVKQFVHEISKTVNVNQEMIAKVEELKKIFRSVSFKQCVVFSNSQSRAESYSNYLNRDEWPCEVIMGSYDQQKRLQILTKLKEFKCRILISTDLMSRGIDLENVNLVINLDVPNGAPVYLHRIGRAGRYGSYGIAITFATSGDDMNKFQKLLGTIGGDEMSVMRFPTDSSSADLWNFENREKEKEEFGVIRGIVDEKKVDTSENVENITENLMLLEISKMLVESDVKQTTKAIPSFDDLFDDFTQRSSSSTKNQECQPQSPAEVIKEETEAVVNTGLLAWPMGNDKFETISNIASTVVNIGTETNSKYPDDSDSDRSQFGSGSSVASNEDNSSSSSDEGEDENCDSGNVDCQIFYRNMDKTSHQPNQKHQHFESEMYKPMVDQNFERNIWYQQYYRQITAIQSYVNFCRSSN